VSNAVTMLKRRLELVRQEDGVALVLVVLLIALLAGLSVTLIDQVTSESGRSAAAVSKQAAFEAAEAGVDDYISKLIYDHLFYAQYVAKGESTRQPPSGAAVTTSPNTGPSVLPNAWPYSALTWTYPNGKDQWRQLANGYEYNLQITAPTAGSTSVGIISTGRPIGSTNISDRRVIQVLARPTSLTDFYRVVDGDVGWGSGASTYGKIYANGNVTHDGTAYASIYATGSISGSVSMQNGAQKYTPSTTPNLASQIKNPIVFSSFLTSLSDISRAAQQAGVYLNAAGITAWKLVFSSAGTFTAQSCTSANVATNVPTCGSATTYNVPTNGAIYSPQDVIVSGQVKGRVTVASNGDIIVGGPVAPITPGTDVLGLDAYSDVIVAGYTPTSFAWGAAVLAQTGTWKSDPGSPSHGSGSTMDFTGMSATADGGSFAGMFNTRNYNYDSTLLYLSPPWFPVLDSLYETNLFRELPAS
jgi:hypothetical protein